MQNSKASKMFDSQPLGHVICSNYIDYNLIILIFIGDVLINFDSPCPHSGDPLPPRMGMSLMDAPPCALTDVTDFLLAFKNQFHEVSKDQNTFAKPSLNSLI